MIEPLSVRGELVFLLELLDGRIIQRPHSLICSTRFRCSQKRYKQDQSIKSNSHESSLSPTPRIAPMTQTQGRAAISSSLRLRHRRNPRHVNPYSKTMTRLAGGCLEACGRARRSWQAILLRRSTEP